MDLRDVLARLIAFAGVILMSTGQLHAGPKYPTTPELRAGMEAIRSDVINIHTLVTHRRLPTSMGRDFLASVSAQLDIISNDDADSLALQSRQKIFDQIRRGAAAIARQEPDMAPIDGLVLITEALAQYGRDFDHKDWKPLQDY